MTGFD